TRISLVLGCFKALRILYPDRSLADRWAHLQNSNPMFGSAKLARSGCRKCQGRGHCVTLLQAWRGERGSIETNANRRYGFGAITKRSGLILVGPIGKWSA